MTKLEKVMNSIWGIMYLRVEIHAFLYTSTRGNMYLYLQLNKYLYLYLHMEIRTSAYTSNQIFGNQSIIQEKLASHLHKYGNPKFSRMDETSKGKLIQKRAQDKSWVRAALKKCKEEGVENITKMQEKNQDAKVKKKKAGESE